ncbi:hypothetical protein QE152_g22649 [Popillia japonica]|uniref:Uncharacterized protein n=1 Tax=Popillia japonica TaxID=7064 RepID=A0AAW1KKB8_POPJA
MAANDVIRLSMQRCILDISSELAEILSTELLKKKRCWVRKWLSSTLLRELATEDLSEYRNYMRMSKDQFDILLDQISPRITKNDTIMRTAIPNRIKLEITLSYFATGNSFRSLQRFFRVSRSAISKFIPEVCDAICESLKEYIKVRPRFSLPTSPSNVRYDKLLTIPLNIVDLLSLGPRFSLPTSPSNVRYDKLLADIEFILNSVEVTERDILRSNFVYYITEYMKSDTNCKLVGDVRKFLREHSNVIISRTDITNSTVCMYFDECNHKMLELLQDVDVYKILKNDPTTTYERKSNQFIKDLKNLGYIDEQTSPIVALLLLVYMVLLKLTKQVTLYAPLLVVPEAIANILPNFLLIY